MLSSHIEGKIKVICQIRENGKPSKWAHKFENNAFLFEAKDGEAVFRFKNPINRQKAQERVRSFLSSFEGNMTTQTGDNRRDFWISQIYGPGSAVCAMTGPCYLKIPQEQVDAYQKIHTPWIQHRYIEIPLIDGLIRRFEEYLNGKEKIAVVGFLCLSALTAMCNGQRREVARRLNIDNGILNDLGQLVSTVGTFETARKIDSKSHQLREYSDSEIFWIERVILELICRAGEVLGGREVVVRLSVSDLPSIVMKQSVDRATGAVDCLPRVSRSSSTS